MLLAFDDQTPPAWAAQLGRATLLEASIMPHADYGERLERRRLAALPGAAGRHRLAPHRADPEGHPSGGAVLLRDCGVDALMYGVVVTGEQPDGFERVARAYRAAFERPAGAS